LQAELVKKKILQVAPETEVEIIGRSSRGDKEISVPLSTLDGTDFFTQEIFEALQKNEAEIAVHSLKDMSAPHFFSHKAFAIVDREDVRDVAIFNSNVIEKIKLGETLIIGTCAPRREFMAIHFLKKALPQYQQEIRIEIKPIRGNVEGRLLQLHEGKYDGTILATAGLNRLLMAEAEEGIADESVSVTQLIKDKRLMFLPLIECVPAPCQGTIVAEANPDNAEVVELLKKINVNDLMDEVYAEKKKAYEYGTGCLQKFGVVTLHTQHGNYLFASGADAKENIFTEWNPLPNVNLLPEEIFSSTDQMRAFFTYEWLEQKIEISEPLVFVANYKALIQPGIASMLVEKQVWASGTKTWYELAKMGVWVQGSADALGFEQWLPILAMPLIHKTPDDICILTHHKAAERWKIKGKKAVANYRLVPQLTESIQQIITSARGIFWSSYAQYDMYGKYAASDAVHICAGGETAQLLRQHGIEPIIFPTIKAFDIWRKSVIPVRKDGIGQTNI
jgi:hydroxymethylbilane synthase